MGIQAARCPLLSFWPPSSLVKMEDILANGSKWLFAKISKESRASDLNNALTFGSHKGALTKPDILKKLVSKYVKYSYSIPIPLESVQNSGVRNGANEYDGTDHYQQTGKGHPKR